MRLARPSVAARGPTQRLGVQHQHLGDAVSFHRDRNLGLALQRAEDLQTARGVVEWVAVDLRDQVAGLDESRAKAPAGTFAMA